MHFMDDSQGKSMYNTEIHFSAIMWHQLKCFTELKEKGGALFSSKYTIVQESLLYYINCLLYLASLWASSDLIIQICTILHILWNEFGK